MNRSTGLNATRDAVPRPALWTCCSPQGHSGLGQHPLAPLLLVQTAPISFRASDKPSCCCGQAGDARATNVCRLSQETRLAVLGSKEQKEALLSERDERKGAEGPLGRPRKPEMEVRAGTDYALTVCQTRARHSVGFLPSLPRHPCEVAAVIFPRDGPAPGPLLALHCLPTVSWATKACVADKPRSDR